MNKIILQFILLACMLIYNSCSQVNEDKVANKVKNDSIEKNPPANDVVLTPKQKDSMKAAIDRNYQKYMDSLNNANINYNANIINNAKLEKKIINEFKQKKETKTQTQNDITEEELSKINATCKVALGDYLNDPDYEVVKQKYYVHQIPNGYIYKLLIRGKNAFGAKIMKEITFNLQYSPTENWYNITSISEN